MGKIREYMKLIPRGIPNIKDIINGVINNVEMQYNGFPEEQRNEIIKRRVLCETCPFNNRNANSSKEYKEITGENYVSSRNDFHCSFCGCPIEIRTASLSSNCGIEYWNISHNANVPLKWKKYGKEIQNKKDSNSYTSRNS